MELGELNDFSQLWLRRICEGSMAVTMATPWVWTENNDRPDMTNGEITPEQKLEITA
jgi:hypothetical protein